MCPCPYGASCSTDRGLSAVSAGDLPYLVPLDTWWCCWVVLGGAGWCLGSAGALGVWRVVVVVGVVVSQRMWQGSGMQVEHCYVQGFYRMSDLTLIFPKWIRGHVKIRPSLPLLAAVGCCGAAAFSRHLK